MAHELEEQRFQYLSTFGKPWHPIGHPFTEEIKDMVEATLKVLPESYDKEICYIKRGDTYVPVQDYRIITRSDEKEIGAVSSGFELLQPVEATHPMQAFIDSGMCTLDCMGVLKEGKQLFATFKVNKAEAEIVPGDPIQGYIVVATGFEGSLSYLLLNTNTRVVCNNTLQAAILGNRNVENSYKLRHTKNIRTKIIDAAKAIAQAMSHFEKGVEAYKALAAKPMSAEEMVTYVKRVFIDDALEKKLAEEGKDPTPNMVAKIERVCDLLLTQEGYDLVPAMHGTAWQAYNAVTQYLTHDQGRTEESRLHNQWFGPAVTMNNRALELALN